MNGLKSLSYPRVCSPARGPAVVPFAVLCAAFVLCFGVSAATVTLLPFHAGWAYFDKGYPPEEDWASRSYDSAWNFSFAQFGYGEGDERTRVYYGTNAQDKFITTYFRTTFWVDDPAQLQGVTFSLLRDDGAVLYLNGVELYRSNMPDDDIDMNTLAAAELAPWERTVEVTKVLPSFLVQGRNLISVEVHKATPSSPILSFDLQITASTIESGGTTPQVSRGPYLQVGTSSNMIVRWRTPIPTDSVVLYGTDPGALDLAVTNRAVVTEHQMRLPDLAPATRYYYQIGTTTEVLAGDATYFFNTAPVPGTVAPVRVWAIGDFGTGLVTQRNVRDAFSKYTGARPADVWLMLGDNAYQSGLDYEYQAYVFDVYPTFFRQSVVWPTVGNHDTAQSATFTDAYPYYSIFSFPTNGEAGGVPSGSKHYYSYDFANVHFICLDSMAADLRKPTSAMATWLRADLADTTRDWIIAYWHHPAYTKGTHDSDYYIELIEMRQNFLPILEAAGVDVVLYGHSHCYERSFLIDGFYTYSWGVNGTNFVNRGDGRTNGAGAYLKPGGGVGARRGAVYITDGSSGYNGAGFFGHPAMYYSTADSGSVVLDIVDQRLDAKFIREDGVISDYFTIDKSDHTNAVPALTISRAGTNSVLSWPTSHPDFRLETVALTGSGAAPGTPQELLENPWHTTWTPAPFNVRTNGRRKLATIPRETTTNQYQFFRLRR